MKGKLQFLGTGGSWGLPVVGCSCPVCHSTNPHNQRLRSSVILKFGTRSFLIDVGPDFRVQALRYGISHLDGLLLTHSHNDHVAGIDDLRPILYLRQSPLPVLLSRETSEDIQLRYHYLFRAGEGNREPLFTLQLLPDRQGDVQFEGIPITYVSYLQAGMVVTGYRFGPLAYISDIRTFDPQIFDQLKGVKTLIISALRYTPSPIHFSVDEAIDFARQLKAEKVWLTHISHDLEHEKTNAYLPANMSLAYDGLEIEVS